MLLTQTKRLLHKQADFTDSLVHDHFDPFFKAGLTDKEQQTRLLKGVYKMLKKVKDTGEATGYGSVKNQNPEAAVEELLVDDSNGNLLPLDVWRKAAQKAIEAGAVEAWDLVQPTGYYAKNGGTSLSWDTISDPTGVVERVYGKERVPKNIAKQLEKLHKLDSEYSLLNRQADQAYDDFWKKHRKEYALIDKLREKANRKYRLKEKLSGMKTYDDLFGD